MNTAGYGFCVGRKPHEPKTELGKWVRKIRVSNRLNQDDFAHTVGVNRVTVTKWESTGAGMRADSIARIRRAFPGTEKPPLGDLSDRSSKVTDEAFTSEATVHTREGIMVGQELDEIDNTELRKRARTAAMAAIEAEVAKSHPSVPGAGGGPAARR